MRRLRHPEIEGKIERESRCLDYANIIRVGLRGGGGGLYYTEQMRQRICLGIFSGKTRGPRGPGVKKQLEQSNSQNKMDMLQSEIS